MIADQCLSRANWPRSLAFPRIRHVRSSMMNALTKNDDSDSKGDALQWGRDLSVTETGVAFGYRHQPYHLQWGCDLSVTETVRWRPLRCRSRRTRCPCAPQDRDRRSRTPPCE